LRTPQTTPGTKVFWGLPLMNGTPTMAQAMAYIVLMARSLPHFYPQMPANFPLCRWDQCIHCCTFQCLQSTAQLSCPLCSSP
jgi:hypothetical protein